MNLHEAPTLKSGLVRLMPTRLLSRIVRKPDICLCENKGADQLRSNCEADQRLCFRYSDGTISLLPKSEISSFYPPAVSAQAGLCQTWSETPKTGFLTSLLKFVYLEQSWTSKYISFPGPRTCLGEPLARMELFLVFANLLQRFSFEREDPNVKHSLQPRLNQITNSPLPYKIRVKQR